MDYHQFLGQVQHRAQLGTFEEAVRATRATLETLGERLYGGEAGNLAAQLPEELGHYLLETAACSEAFDLDEFINRVQMREGVDLPLAVFHSRVVCQVMREAVSPTLMKKVLDQLPPEYDTFIQSGQNIGEPRRPSVGQGGDLGPML
jgi:uncharacterized protein (DUF2267 family)